MRRLSLRTMTALLLVGLTACTTGTDPAPSSDSASTAPASTENPTGNNGLPVHVVQVSVSHCGQGWAGAAAGAEDFELHNTDTRPGEVALVDPESGAVFGDVEPLGPGTSVGLSIVLAAGNYAFRCVMEDADAITGPTVTLVGSAADPARGVQPVTAADLYPAVQGYQAYVNAALPILATQAGTLSDDVSRDDLAAARSDWLTAHLSYERLGAAYGAFGDADDAINGLPFGLPNGTADAGFTGFHRIEYLLWHGGGQPDLVAAATALKTAIDQLGVDFRQAQVDPLEVSIRAHEITENALQFELTGRTDFGSSSNLATVAANLDGTEEVLSLLRPLLADRYSAIAELDAQLAQTRSDLNATEVDGGWIALSALPPAQRKRIDADVSQLAQLLAPVAVICEPRRVK